jgi:apolipoprotein N-acyltransferase
MANTFASSNGKNILVIALACVVVAVGFFALKGSGNPADKAIDRIAPSSGTPGAGTGSNTSAAQMETDRLREQEDLIEQRQQLQETQTTAPLEAKTQQMEQQQQALEQQQELIQRSEAVPYEIEIERLRQQQQLLAERKKLREMQQEEIAPLLTENPPDPVTNFSPGTR